MQRLVHLSSDLARHVAMTLENVQASFPEQVSSTFPSMSVYTRLNFFELSVKMFMPFPFHFLVSLGTWTSPDSR